MENIIFIKQIEKYLAAKKVPSALSEAEALVLFFSKLTRTELYSGLKSISPATRKKILTAAQKRGKGIPSSHITGEKEFSGHRFAVNRHVLTPRPETEILVEEALAILKAPSAPKFAEILDLGTGSGCIAASLTIAHPEGKMTALDSSPRALAVARKNFQSLKLGKKIRTVKSSFFGAFDGKNFPGWDIIISNPPYLPAEDWKKLPREVRREPRAALISGKKGFDAIREILKQAPRFLKKGGWILLEIGEGQSEVLKKEIEKQNVFTGLRFVKDLAGTDRVLIAKHG
jgi:release factor glutamine methyltransferase